MESPCVGLAERKGEERGEGGREGRGKEGGGKEGGGKGKREMGIEEVEQTDKGKWEVGPGSLILSCFACRVFTSPGGVLPSGESSTYSAAHVTTSASDRASPTMNWGQLVRWLSSRPKHTSNSCEREPDIMVDFTAPCRNETSQV